MSVVEGGEGRRNLFQRVINMFTTPRTEWEVIDLEPQTTQSLYMGYAVPLAAIPALIGLVFALLLASMFGMFAGMMGMFGAAAASPIIAVMSAIVNYAVSLICLFVFALIIDGLAPSFGGVRDRIQALKVATFTAVLPWAASVAMIIPPLGILVVLAASIYAIYVCHLGLKTVMKVPEDKSVGYTAVVIVLGVVAWAIINGVANFPLGIMRRAAVVSVVHNDTIKLPGGVSFNLREAERAADDARRAAEQAREAASSGQVVLGQGAPANAVAPDVLQTMLPANIPGYTRTEVSSGGGGIGGIGGTGAHAVYTKGESRIEVTVTDLGAMGAMVSAVGVNANKQTATGYSKVSSANGRMTTEEYDRSTNHGTYSVAVGKFMVAAEGDKVTMEDLKNAVGQIPLDRLQAMAKS